MKTFVIDLPGVVIDNPDLPQLIEYADLFEATPGFVAHWDFTDTDLMTIVGGKLSSITAAAGVGTLSQSTDTLRPPVAGTDVNFSAHVLIYEGAHPTGNHAVAAIVECDFPASDMTIAGYGRQTSVDNTRHFLGLTTSAGTPYASYSAGPTGYANRYLDAGSQKLLLIGEYVSATGACQLEMNGLPQQFTGGNGVGTMNTGFRVGMGGNTGGAPFIGKIRDVFLFDQAVITLGNQQVLRDYGRDIRAISV